MKKLLFIFIGLLLCLVTSCSQRVEYNEDEYVHSLASIIDANHSYKYRNVLPNEMEGAFQYWASSSPWHLDSHDKIKQAYTPLKTIKFKYLKELSKEDMIEFYMSFGVKMSFSKKNVYIYFKENGKVLFQNIDNDYFISEDGVIDMDEYAMIFYSEWNKGK